MSNDSQGAIPCERQEMGSYSPTGGTSASMSTTHRFRSEGNWSLIPGPAEMENSMSSLDLEDIVALPAASVAESFLAFPGMRQLRPTSPAWWDWRARWESGTDFIEVGMTLLDDEQQSWGGSAIVANCQSVSIEALWSHLATRHSGVWLHDPDCVIHTPDSFKALEPTEIS